MLNSLPAFDIRLPLSTIPFCGLYYNHDAPDYSRPATGAKWNTEIVRLDIGVIGDCHVLGRLTSSLRLTWNRDTASLHSHLILGLPRQKLCLIFSTLEEPGASPAAYKNMGARARQTEKGTPCTRKRYSRVSKAGIIASSHCDYTIS